MGSRRGRGAQTAATSSALCGELPEPCGARFSAYQGTVPRAITKRYDDPLDLVWLACAREVGLEVRRSEGVYASYDGEGTLSLSRAEHFDADDSLAQLLFHELCHALVAGPRGLRQVDWGMENVDERDALAERACHRLQAALADRHGLRHFFAVTTDHRAYWDELPLDTLAPGTDPAIPLARDAFERALHGPWAGALARALERTRQLASLVRSLDLPADSLWRDTAELHRAGFALAPEGQCGDCAFALARGPRLRCVAAQWGPAGKAVSVSAHEPACVRFQARFAADECARCGACCREAFHRVEVRASDLVRKRHRALVAEDGFGLHLPRPGGRCVALAPDSSAGHRCTIYEERPKSCAEFAIGGEACLEARRRLAL